MEIIDRPLHGSRKFSTKWSLTPDLKWSADHWSSAGEIAVLLAAKQTGTLERRGGERAEKKERSDFTSKSNNPHSRGWGKKFTDASNEKPNRSINLKSLCKFTANILGVIVFCKEIAWDALIVDVKQISLQIFEIAQDSSTLEWSHTVPKPFLSDHYTIPKPYPNDLRMMTVPAPIKHFWWWMSTDQLLIPLDNWCHYSFDTGHFWCKQQYLSCC